MKFKTSSCSAFERIGLLSNTTSILFAALAVGMALTGISNPAVAQDPPKAFVTPGPNVNAVGTTPDWNILRVPDLFRKQQNEPSCIQATDNPANVFCGFNDCRASDWPEVQGDCWIGVGQSRDFGETWNSRLAPGYLAHPHSIGWGFAADAAVSEIPGNSPGMILLTYIASTRGQDDGVIATQRYVQNPREDGEPWLPVDGPPTIMATGSEGRFHDKVASIFVVNEDDPQSSTSESVFAEGISEAIDINRLDGAHIVAYTVFTGEGSATKIMAQSSFDGGQTYGHARKASAELNTVTGVHLSYIPGKGLSLIYRRSADSNEPDAIMQTFSTNLGRTWSKAQPVYEICSYDSQASGVTPRIFTFPWGADDGERFWVFSADRVNAAGERIAALGECTQVPGAPPGTYPGVPRIVGMSSLDGRNWYGGADNPDEPFILDFNDGVGYQIFPFSQGVKNRVDIAWWDTREEDAIRDAPLAQPELPLIYDYMSATGRVFRTANIYMTRISGCDPADPPGSDGCTPFQPKDDVSQNLVSPVRISRYQTADLNGVVQELEANRLCLRTHGSGRLCYNGDYGSVGTRRFRRLPSGKVVQNSLGQQSGEDNFVAEENMILAWGENRDVFGDFVGNVDDPLAQFLYTPPANAAPVLQAPGLQADSGEAAGSAETVLTGEPADKHVLQAVNEPDDEAGLGPEADIPGACSAAQNFSFARDSGVYVSYVEDKPSMVALTQGRQLNATQRMFPLVIGNPGTDPDGLSVCLHIAQRPADWGGGRGSGRASFNPLPALNNPDPDEPPSPVLEYLDVHAGPKSSAARSVFVTSSDPNTRVIVNAHLGFCPDPVQTNPNVPSDPPSGAIISSVQVGNGELFDPLFCEQNPAADACVDPVATHETHNISLASPGLQAPGLQAPVLQAPSLQALLLGAPSLQAPGLQATGFQAEGAEAPVLQAPSFEAQTYEANSLISPGLQAPSLQAPSLQAALENPDADGNVDIFYQDLTRTVLAEANVTTTYSADIAIVGLDPAETAVELFAWQPNVHATTVIDPVTGQCLAVPEADNKVIAAVDMNAPGLQAPGLQAPSLGDVSLPFAFPDNQAPYNGDMSFSGKPGDRINITTRIWVTGSAKETLDRLYACSTEDDPDPSLDCQPQEIANGAFVLNPFGAGAHGCSTVDVFNADPNIDCISAGAEKIEPPDLFAPVFSPPDGSTVEHEAALDGNGDCCAVSTPGTVPVGISVTDQDPDTTVSCSSTGVTLVDGTTTFPFGGTDVDCTAIDTSLNQADATITISIVDNVVPVINMPASITNAEATDPSGVFVAYELTATDITDTTIACTRPDGSGGTEPVSPIGDTYFVGTTTVTCTATDEGENTDSGTFDITVNDVGVPTITVTLDDPQPVEATGPDGAPVDFTVNANDAIDGDNVTTECRIDGTGPVVVSGSTFAYVPPGPTTTSVTCTVTDQSGNSASSIFSATVDDSTPPNLTVPDDFTVAVDAIVDYSDHGVDATDTVDSDPVITCVPPSGSVFDTVGTTTVSCTATDNSNNTSAAKTFDVIVEVAPGGITAKRSVKAGASNPVRWTWDDADGNAIDVGILNHDIEARPGGCPSDPGVTDILVDDPGSSFYQFFPDGNINGYNWQTPQDASGPYCIRVILLTTGQTQETATTIRQ